MAARYYHSEVKRYYAQPGQSAKADGFNIDFSGDAEFQAMLLRMYPLIVKRAIGICRTLGEDLAVQANRAAPVGKRQKGRPGGRLARSFGVKERPMWLKFGKAGVAVRSSAKYHHPQEFGFDRENVQVLLHRDASGKKVAKGQGEGKRYRTGTGRLNPGVFVKSYRRHIKIPANPFFGDVVRRNKDRYTQEARDGMLKYISRLAQSGAKGEAT